MGWWRIDQRARFSALLLLLCMGGAIAGSAATHMARAAASSRSAEPVVAIDSGTLRGTLTSPGAVFKGIPYARPPVGDLRWAAPQPVVPWRGVRAAIQPGSPCVQDPAGLVPFISTLANAYGGTYQHDPIRSSEDCLYLNVWTPAWPAPRGLPVMVWVHGGSNVAGSGSESTYDGAALAAHGVIVVTLNYRLGVLGFFSEPELTRESPHHSSGNYGLLDQLAALAWVQRNIAQFGGDPGNVTLFGESAGAIDAGILMTSPRSTGLFRRVISESGPAFAAGVPLARAEAFGTAVASAAPGNPRLTPLARLRALPAQDVARLAAHISSTRLKAPDGITLDGWALQQGPESAFLQGAIQNVDLLIGINGRELSAFRLMAAAAPKSAGPISVGTPGVRQFAAAAHPYFGLWTDPVIAYDVAEILLHHAPALDQAANDIVVACPIAAVASLTTAAGHRVFVYRFDRPVPGKGEADLGAFHSLDVPYVFNAFQDPAWRWLPIQPVDRRISGTLQLYWTNFARTGNPNMSGLPDWPAWSDSRQQFLDIGKTGAIGSQRGFAPSFSSISAPHLRQRLLHQ